MIAIRELTRRYGPVLAIDRVTVEIGRGEVVGLLGQNGAGKTTLMKVLTGYLEPTSGTVEVGGIDVQVDRIGVQRQIGYLPENAPLYPEMLVQDYLVMMAALRGVPADRIDAAVAQAAADTGLSARLLEPIQTLSKGYRQRVGIAQAIVHQPDVLVLDEPTNGLDPVQIQSIRDLIRRLAARTTVILSTHILQEVEAVCDRVLVLIGGRLVADSPMDELKSSRLLHLSLGEGARGVRDALYKVSGVEAVREVGPDPSMPGFVEWEVRCAPDGTPAPAIAEVAVRHGWRLGAMAREHRTLESVFQQLQRDEAERRQQEAL